MTLKLDAKNARKHSDRNKKSIRKSLEVAKPARSIVLDSGDNVLAGNGVYEQADAMGIPVQIVETHGDVLVAVKRMDVAPESPEARQIATLDNLVADTSYADYDADLLREALANDPVSKAIAEQDERLRKLLGNTGKQETADAGELTDRAAQLQEKWQVNRGDLWQCGKHRILCGDSTNADDVARVMQGEKYSVLADPPYNIGFNYNGIDDKMPDAEWQRFCGEWFKNCCANAIASIVTPGPHNEAFYPTPRDRGFWIKRNATAGASVFHLRLVEPILFYGKFGKKRNTDVFEFSSGFSEELRAARCAARVEDKHPPAKSMPLWVELIGMLDEIVLDPFGGNGTTIIACEQAGRIGRTIELDPAYCGVIIERLSLLGLECTRLAPSP